MITDIKVTFEVAKQAIQDTIDKKFSTDELKDIFKEFAAELGIVPLKDEVFDIQVVAKVLMKWELFQESSLFFDADSTIQTLEDEMYGDL